MASRFAFLLLWPLTLSACALSDSHDPAPTPSSGTNRPSPQRPSDTPVWILPDIRTATVLPSANQEEWRGSYQTASIVAPGYWSTREEAEINGSPYIDPRNENRIVTPPRPTQLPSGLTEQSATPPQAGADPARPATPLASSSPPRIRYSTETNELLVDPGGSDGLQLSVPTPHGPAQLDYQNDKITVSCAGRTFLINQPRPGEPPARARLAN